jgi:hypothetical protein
MVAVLHLLCGLSLAHSSFVLGCLRMILHLSSGTNTGFGSFADHLPKDTRTLLRDFDIEPSSIPFVCCPKCFSCYPIGPNDAYPERCPYRATDTSSVCNRTLQKKRTIKGKTFTYPSRRFLYQDFKAWMGRLISRPGMEEILDRPLDKGDPDITRDILESKILQDFIGPDEKPFLGSLEGGRYIFSLSMDGFNPYHMKEAGKRVSVGAIYMVCLNLPPETRYNFENMYLVGIIPGPAEPSLDQINHLLRPLINDLLLFWSSGVYFSRTPSHPHGRTIRCAVIPLVCDMPAARQMAGYASYSSHHFCSMCLLRLENIDDLDYSHWGKRTCEEHRKLANEWQHAPSETARQDIFNEHGLRYSELLRLPYWDPTLFTLVDSMHSLFLGNFRRHCRYIWKMNVAFTDSDGSWTDPGMPGLSDATSEERMERGWFALRTGTEKSIGRVSKPVLQQLCRETQTLPEPRYRNKKKHLIRQLLAYVSCPKIFV